MTRDDQKQIETAPLLTLSESDDYWLRRLDQAGHSAFSLVVDYLRKAVVEIDAQRAAVAALSRPAPPDDLVALVREYQQAMSEWRDPEHVSPGRRLSKAENALLALRFRPAPTDVEDAAAALTAISRDLEMARQHIKACEAMIREHAEAAAIFQPGGRLHDRANLILGRSSVVEGIAWLVAQLDQSDAAVREARAETWEAACKLVVQYGGDMTALLNRLDEQTTTAQEGRE